MNPIDGLLPSKRPSFSRKKAMFCKPKDGLLQHIEYQYVAKAFKRRTVKGAF